MMQFTFINNRNQQQGPAAIPMYYGKTQRQSLSQITKAVPVVVQSTEPEVKTENKMKWGEPIWFLFHTLAQKVKPEAFPYVRVELLNNIYAICANLPCPVCANHATEYLNKRNFNTIHTKDELIRVMYAFHNDVNQRKNMAMFDFADVEDKYNAAVTVNIIQYFMSVFEKKSNNVKNPTQDFNKKNLIAALKKWFNNNIQNFEP
jgi:Erv1 / Alr family